VQAFFIVLNVSIAFKIYCVGSIPVSDIDAANTEIIIGFV
jgi:hypothetical protein